MNIAKDQMIDKLSETFPKEEKARIRKGLSKKSYKFLEEIYNIFYDAQAELRKAVDKLDFG